MKNMKKRKVEETKAALEQRVYELEIQQRELENKRIWLETMIQTAREKAQYTPNPTYN